MFTQVQYMTQAMFTTGTPGMRGLVDGHTHHFTFGENAGAPDCRMPLCGVHWRPTRQPVCLSEWPAEAPPAGVYTTVMNWSAAPPLEFENETWGQKNVEFRRFIDVPELAPEIPLAVAVGQTMGAPFPTSEAAGHGWRVLDPTVCAPDWRTYRQFIQSSRGEFSVAKETYVKARTGWFSCRSACYLACARPVITQDTGWTRHLPSGTGLLAFEDRCAAVEALRVVENDIAKHSAAARTIAKEFFDSRRVLGDMLSQIA